jgi:hypothetical protein
VGSAWWPRRLLTPTDDPVGELSRVVGELSVRPAEEVADAVRRRPDHLPVLLQSRGWERAVLVVDQFEELFAPTVPRPTDARSRLAELERDVGPHRIRQRVRRTMYE